MVKSPIVTPGETPGDDILQKYTSYKCRGCVEVVNAFYSIEQC